MNKLFDFLQLLLLSTSGMLLLCIIFAINPGIYHGEVIGRICWFHYASVAFAGSLLFMELTSRKRVFIFSLPDVLVLLLLGIVLVAYDKQLNIQPDKLIFISQLVALWFMLRISLQRYPELRIFFVSIALFFGTVCAISCIRLYFGNFSDHPILKLLDGAVPLGLSTGYITVMLPISLNMFLRFRNCKKLSCWESRTFLFYLACVGFISISVALCLRMNLSVLIVSAVSCCWVCWMRMIGLTKTKEAIYKYRKLFVVASLMMLLFIAAGLLLSAVSFHSGAVQKHLLIWNVTTNVIIKHPFLGTGLGSFPSVYAKAQADYFTSGIASDTECGIGMCPDYPYNDYLLMGVEVGVVGLLLFMLWLAFSVYYGIKHNRIGCSGGVIALVVFALYSYPLQLPTLCVLLIFLTTMCVTKKGSSFQGLKSLPYIGILIAIVSCAIFYAQKDSVHIYKEWKSSRDLYLANHYELAAYRYEKLYFSLYHRPDFLYEGATCFNKIGKYSTAVVWLERAMQLSANPQIYYAMAMNDEALGNYEDAEFYLEKITQILPGHCRGYLMLVQLYANASFYHPDKLKKAASCALRLSSLQKEHAGEIKREVYKILSDKQLRLE